MDNRDKIDITDEPSISTFLHVVPLKAYQASPETFEGRLLNEPLREPLGRPILHRRDPDLIQRLL